MCELCRRSNSGLLDNNPASNHWATSSNIGRNLNPKPIYKPMAFQAINVWAVPGIELGSIPEFFFFLFKNFYFVEKIPYTYENKFYNRIIYFFMTSTDSQLRVELGSFYSDFFSSNSTRWICNIFKNELSEFIHEDIFIWISNIISFEWKS